MTGASCRAAAVLGMAVALAFAPVTVRADDPPDLPGGTDAHAGLPPLVPHAIHDCDTVRRWCDEAVAAGRAQRGTMLGGDLLLSAAWALDRRVGDGANALELYVEAARAYPARVTASGRIAALLEAARLQGLAGDVEAQRRSFDEAKRLGNLGPPVDADATESLRWSVLAARLVLALPRMEANLLEAEGRLAAAATVLERSAETQHRDLDPSRAWARAARLRARAGDKDQALADVDRALERNTSERFAADWSFWRLHLVHDRLDDEGAVPILTSWPGEDFTREVHACLHGLRGNPHAGSWLLTVASNAMAAGENQVALDLYLIALGDRAFLDAARERPLIWRGLLAAFPVALRLGRFDEAQRILGAVDRIGGIPREEMDGYRVALAEARARADEGNEPRQPAALDEPVERPPPTPPPSPDRGRLRMPSENDGAVDRVLEEGEGAAAVDAPAWPGPVLGAALFLVLVMVVIHRKRR